MMMMRVLDLMKQMGQTEVPKEQVEWCTSEFDEPEPSTIYERKTLDNGLTLSLFCNPELVENIRESKTILKMHTNAGSKLNNQ